MENQDAQTAGTTEIGETVPLKGVAQAPTTSQPTETLTSLEEAADLQAINTSKIGRQIFAEVDGLLNKRKVFGGLESVEIDLDGIPEETRESIIKAIATQAAARGKITYKEGDTLKLYKSKKVLERDNFEEKNIVNPEIETIEAERNSVGSFIGNLLKGKILQAGASIPSAIKEIPVNIFFSIPAVKRLQEKMDEMEMFGEYTATTFLTKLTGKGFQWGKRVNSVLEGGKLTVKSITDLDASEDEKRSVLKKLGMGAGSLSEARLGDRLRGLINIFTTKEVFNVGLVSLSTGARLGAWLFGANPLLGLDPVATAQVKISRVLDAALSLSTYAANIFKDYAVNNSKSYTSGLVETLSSISFVGTSTFLSGHFSKSIPNGLERFAVSAGIKLASVASYASLVQMYANNAIENPQMRKAFVRERMAAYGQLMSAVIVGGGLLNSSISEMTNEAYSQVSLDNTQNTAAAAVVSGPGPVSVNDGGAFPPEGVEVGGTIAIAGPQEGAFSETWSNDAFDFDGDGIGERISVGGIYYDLKIQTDGTVGFFESDGTFFQLDRIEASPSGGTWLATVIDPSNGQEIGVVLSGLNDGTLVIGSDNVAALNIILSQPRTANFIFPGNPNTLGYSAIENGYARQLHGMINMEARFSDGETYQVYNMSTNIFGTDPQVTGVFMDETGELYFLHNQKDTLGVVTAEIIDSRGRNIGMLINGTFFDNEELASFGSATNVGQPIIPNVPPGIESPPIPESNTERGGTVVLGVLRDGYQSIGGDSHVRYFTDMFNDPSTPVSTINLSTELAVNYFRSLEGPERDAAIARFSGMFYPNEVDAIFNRDVPPAQISEIFTDRPRGRANIVGAASATYLESLGGNRMNLAPGSEIILPDVNNITGNSSQSDAIVSSSVSVTTEQPRESIGGGGLSRNINTEPITIIDANVPEVFVRNFYGVDSLTTNERYTTAFASFGIGVITVLTAIGLGAFFGRVRNPNAANAAAQPTQPANAAAAQNTPNPAPQAAAQAQPAQPAQQAALPMQPATPPPVQQQAPQQNAVDIINAVAQANQPFVNALVGAMNNMISQQNGQQAAKKDHIDTLLDMLNNQQKALEGRDDRYDKLVDEMLRRADQSKVDVERFLREEIALVREINDRVEAVRAAHQREVEKMQVTHDQQVTYLRNTIADVLELEAARIKKENKELKAQLEQQKQQAQSQAKSQAQDLVDINNQIANLTRTIQSKSGTAQGGNLRDSKNWLVPFIIRNQDDAIRYGDLYREFIKVDGGDSKAEKEAARRKALEKLGYTV